MLRGSIVLATLLGAAQSQGPPPPCTDCHFDIRALEEFSTDYSTVEVTQLDRSGPQLGITTGDMPATVPHEHGTIAVNVRNLQFKVDSHVECPTPFAVGHIPLSGMHVHEELHINGATGQASFHVASPIVNLCFQLDTHVPVARMEQSTIETRLHFVEQRSAMMAPHIFHHVNLNGEQVMGPSPGVLFTDSSHPAFVHYEPTPTDYRIMRMFNPPVPPSLVHMMGVKFDNYANSVGSQFSVRACEIADHQSSQSLLAASPDAQQFFTDRISQHQSRLQYLFQNTTGLYFNPMEVSDLMVPSEPCANEELAQMPSTALSTSQTAAFSVGSFVVGVAITWAVARKTRTTSGDDYHQVVA